jgi:hypothetical protein
MTHARNLNTSANGGYALNPTKEDRSSMSLPAKARATVMQALMCFMCLTSLIVHVSAQTASTTTTITASGAPGNYTLTTTVSGPARPSIAPSGNVSFEDTTNGNFLLGTGNLGAPTIAQSFVQQPSPVTTFAPFAVAIGDFNRDGKGDMVVENQTMNQLDLFVGNGDGTFGNPTVISLPGFSSAQGNGGIAVADFNKDGTPDLAVLSGNSGTTIVNILLGNGNGTFTAFGAVGSNPFAFAVGDINQDGNLDIVTVQSCPVTGGCRIGVYLGNGSGGFTQVPDSDGNPYAGVAIGDFNGDGKPDLFLLENTGARAFVRLGNGNGTFQSTMQFAVTSPLINPVVGDFNGDGRSDVAILNSTSQSIQILLGNSDGTFTSSTIGATGLSFVSSLVSLDFNADGKLDLVATTSSGFVFFVGNGNGTFQAPISSSFSASPARAVLAAGDLNGDGNLDLAIPSTDNSINILLDNVTATSTATLTGVSISGAGTHFADAVFAGNTYYSTSTSGTVPLIGSPVPTALTLMATPSSSVPGQQVALTAVLNPFSVGSMTTNGEPVFFSIGGSSIGSALLSSGVATLQTTSLPTGTDTITANYRTDSNFLASGATTTVTVAKTTPTITWANPAAITYGTALTGIQLNATASTPGTFIYSPLAGTVLGAGPQTLTVNFTPTDTTNFNNASASVTLMVNKATPTITWANPAAITYGTALTGIQLDATASTPGNFVYSPVAGTVLGAGPQTLSVTFTPNDLANFTVASATVPLIVNKATPTITWANPAAITYGTALSGGQLNATASTMGNFVYSPVVGTVLGAGPQTLSVAFTPNDTADFNDAAATVTLIVNKETPTITWANPAAITYGTALTGIQLDATASTPGTFTYSPATGAVLGGGPQTLSVAFTPTDTADFNNQTATVTMIVNKATPTITWANPAAIPYGTALTGIQLDATASVPGTFAYAAPAGTILSSGPQTITATLTPTDTTDFNTATASVTLNVTKVTPTISWPNPAAITYGTALSDTQLDATASVPGTFNYSPTAGTVLGAGPQTLSVTFTPTDGRDYNPTMATAALMVNKATPTITWANPASITYGTSLSGTQLNATASVPGNFVYSPVAGTILGAGTQTLSAIFTPTDGADYSAATATATIAVTKAAVIGSITSNLDPSTFSLSVTLTFTYTGVAGLPLPTGSVTVVDGGNALVTLPLNTAGVASYTTSDLAVGSHGLVATYGGDANYKD